MSSPPHRPLNERIVVVLFVTIPLVALLATVPIAWGWGLSWIDLSLTVFFYLISGAGNGVGHHRLFTHRSFKARRSLKIALALAGGMALQGPVVTWVADHRMHHRYADREGDPHSPWRFGDTPRALAKGMLHAHIGWLLTAEHAPIRTYARDIIADPDLVRISRCYWNVVFASLLLPPLMGGLLTWSWQGAVTAFFWGSLVRIGLVHHMTWSVNSVCHVWGDRPFRSPSRASNVWWLALLSLGESWHNLHHADPTCARYGVLRGQVDAGARLIRWLEKAGWAHDVRWPTPGRTANRLITAQPSSTTAEESRA
ncbi:acyl-CoA desaturase [Streptomyces sp. NPDC127051]|uniref:acyl-CoA desaturase n=1 Tax=Streptomyces sp. NPDC127051 TaxID=3347119 RepID=UPI00365A6E2B